MRLYFANGKETIVTPIPGYDKVGIIKMQLSKNKDVAGVEIDDVIYKQDGTFQLVCRGYANLHKFYKNGHYINVSIHNDIHVIYSDAGTHFKGTYEQCMAVMDANNPFKEMPILYHCNLI